MSRPVVLVAEELAPSALAVLSEDFEVRSVDGADREALLPALAGADALIVRSATTVDAEAIAAGARLKVWPAPVSASTMSTSPRRPRAECWWSTRRRRTSSLLPSTPLH